MANDKDFILKNAIEVGGSTKVTIGDAPASGSKVVAYDLSVAAYDSKSFSVAGQEASPIGVTLSLDGTKMFVMGFTGDDINLYNLGTAFDVSTAVSTSTTLPVGSQDNTPWAFDFKPDGTSIYMVGSQNHTVFQYNLTSAFDIGTASYANKSFSVLTQASSARGLTFKPDGTKMYVLDNGADDIHQYSLSTAWDVSTASYDSVSFNVTSQANSPYGITFNADGTELFLAGHTVGAVYKYALTTAYDISTASYSSIYFDFSSQTTTPTDVFFADSGKKMYINSYGDDTIYQYTTGSTVATATFDTSTGNYFTHTPSADAEYGFSNAGDVQTFQLEVTGNQSVVGYDLSEAAYDSISYDMSADGGALRSISFKPDGTKMLVLSLNDTEINEYDLSTAWDITTSSYVQNFNVGGQESSVHGLFLKPDGTKMYVIGQINDTVYQYTLSTAWDVSTSSYDSISFSVSGQETTPSDVFFKPDGTKMYIIGTQGDDVNEYALSTAWDVSSASFTTNFSVASQDTTPSDVFFSPDGLTMFILGDNFNLVRQYSLSTAWDVSSASYDSLVLDTTPSLAPQGFFFKSDGSKMYIVDQTNPFVYQFTTSISTPITITWDADIEWGGGTAPSSPASGQKDLYTITTDDGGTTYFGVPSGVAFS